MQSIQDISIDRRIAPGGTTGDDSAGAPAADPAAAPASSGSRPQRLEIGALPVDVVTFAEALAVIEQLVDRGQGGSVFTPNVDHVVQAQNNAAFRRAYAQVDLSIPDGMPVVWLARAIGWPHAQRVAGSDLILPLMRMAAASNWRVYLLGGAPGVAAAAATRLAAEFGVNVVGTDSPMIAADGSDGDDGSIARAAAARPHLVIVALGAPKQELWIARARAIIGPAVALGLGGSVDFLVGRQHRAPEWLARLGLEWLFRLVHDPRRLWRRYLVEGPRFLPIAFRTWRSGGRVRPRAT